jgi:acyl-coenzyme A synthetase/AMP-(fatty) acid ligase
METITDALARHARERPQAPALVDDRFRLTWGEVASWVEHAAGWLAAQGFARGAPVLGWMPNRLEWYLVRLACERVGLLWIPVPMSQGKLEVASILERVRPVLLISAGQFRQRDYAAEADEICARIGLSPTRLTLAEDELLRLDGPPCDAGCVLRMDDMAHALPTSGSEGIPKLAFYTLHAACVRAHTQAELLGLLPSDIILVLSPGVGPVRAAWLGASVAGSCIVAMPVFSTDIALDLIGRERATIVCGTPAQLVMLAGKLEQADTTTLRIWYTAGSVLSPTLAEDLESRTAAVIVSTYGGADFGGWAAPDPRDPSQVRYHTVGKPRGGSEFRMVDRQGNDVPKGEVGEVIGRGTCCVCGYVGDAGSEQWRAGWFHTGDLGRFDEDGNVVIIGRIKDVINRGGDNVVPSEVEALLRTHPAIGQVAVVGVPDQVLGERVCACVVPARDRSGIDVETLRRHLREHGLAHYKAPERLILLEALPVVGDKIDRRALAALAARQAGV